MTEQLLAAAVDALNVANWQRASGGKRKPKKPKPIPRPGVKGARGKKVAGATAVPLSKAREVFSRHNPAAFGVAVWQPPTCGECDRTDLHARGLCGKHYQRWRRSR